eukprot:6529141-Prorocentrum_lima.AAC.1
MAEASAATRAAEAAIRIEERGRDIARESTREMQEEISRLRTQYENDRQERASQTARDRAMIGNLNQDILD